MVKIDRAAAINDEWKKKWEEYQTHENKTKAWHDENRRELGMNTKKEQMEYVN